MTETLSNQDSNQKEVETKEKVEPENISENPESNPEKKEDSQERNWKEFRKQKEADRKARIEAEERAKQKEEEAEALKKAMEAVLDKKTPQQQDPFSYYEEEDPEENKIQKMIAEALEKDRERQRQEQTKKEQEMIPRMLKQNYSDFEKVCSQENIDYLEFNYPEIATPYRYMPDSFDKWSMVYKAIKKYVPFQDRDSDQKKMERNSLKPQSHAPSVTDKNPQTQGWKLTEQKRMENWRRMQGDMKNIAS